MNNQKLKQKRMKRNIKKLREEAANVVDMFDQANTAGAIVLLGSRGILLRKAVDDLRATLNSRKQRTILTEEEANFFEKNNL